MELIGKVFSGKGEGAGYVKLYNPLFRGLLGFEAFPGTLNLRLAESFSLENPAVITPGEGGLLPVECNKAMVNGVKAAVVRPRGGSYGEEVLEIVAPLNLREALGLKDRDEVKVIL